MFKIGEFSRLTQVSVRMLRYYDQMGLLKPYTPSFDRVQNPGTPDWCSHWPKSLEASASFEWENEFNF